MAAVTHTQSQAIVPANTEIHAADHDYNGLAKAIPSVSLQINIGEDQSDSLVGGGEDGNSQVYVSVHDGVFYKSDNYHHVASNLLIVRNERIQWLAEVVHRMLQLLGNHITILMPVNKKWWTLSYLYCLDRKVMEEVIITTRLCKISLPSLQDSSC